MPPRQMGLAVDYEHYLEAIQAPLLRLVEIPLRTLSPGAYEELVAFTEQARNRARALNAEHSRCRIGAEWKNGHKTKDGRVQTKLVLQNRVAPRALPPKAKRNKAGGASAGSGDVGGPQKKSIAQFFNFKRADSVNMEEPAA